MRRALLGREPGRAHRRRLWQLDRLLVHQRRPGHPLGEGRVRSPAGYPPRWPRRPRRSRARGLRPDPCSNGRGADLTGSGAADATMGINGPYLGPTLRARGGSRVRVKVSNDSASRSTAALARDAPARPHGRGPAPARGRGDTWVDRRGGSTSRRRRLWYHPHLHGRTGRAGLPGAGRHVSSSTTPTADVLAAVDYASRRCPVTCRT
jgi:hypothetical protein